MPNGKLESCELMKTKNEKLIASIVNYSPFHSSKGNQPLRCNNFCGQTNRCAICKKGI